MDKENYKPVDKDEDEKGENAITDAENDTHEEVNEEDEAKMSLTGNDESQGAANTKVIIPLLLIYLYLSSSLVIV